MVELYVCTTVWLLSVLKTAASRIYIYICMYNYLMKGTLKQMCMIEDALSMIREKVQPPLLAVIADFDVLCL